MGSRSKISGTDFAAVARAGFLKDGSGVVATRQPERVIQDPEWLANNPQIVDFIKKQFPLAGKVGKVCGCGPCSFPKVKLRRDKCRCRWCRQTMLAARWTAVIVRWFVLKLPDTEIEVQYGWKAGTVGSIVQKIRRIRGGQRQDGRPRTGKGRGRPKKIASEPIIPDNQETDCVKSVRLNLQCLLIPANPHALNDGRVRTLPT